jgi:hypothetical protein
VMVEAERRAACGMGAVVLRQVVKVPSSVAMQRFGFRQEPLKGRPDASEGDGKQAMVSHRLSGILEGEGGVDFI